MRRGITRAIAWGQLALAAVPGSAALAQMGDPRFASMAPIEQYLMDRQAEIALAKSAAPTGISNDAEILVLGRKGYETAIAGKNGFVCFVDRSYQAPFDDPNFWNPRTRGASCYNPPAARTVLKMMEKRQDLILSGLSKDQVMERLNAAFAKGELPAPAPGSMCYMMSKGSHLNNATNLAHLMFFEPLTDPKVWDASVPNAPFFVSQNPVEHVTTLILPVGNWSDGSPVTADHESAHATANSGSK